MLRKCVLLLAFAAAANAQAQKCVSFTVLPTSGICKGVAMSSKSCSPLDGAATGTLMQVVADTMTADQCAMMKEANPQCGAMGTAGKPKATFCDAGGPMCSGSTMCSADTDCPAVGEMPTKMPCCENYKTMQKAQAAALCDGVSDADIDKMVETLKTAGGCKDTDCIAVSSAPRSYSLASVAMFVPALVALATVF